METAKFNGVYGALVNFFNSWKSLDETQRNKAIKLFSDHLDGIGLIKEKETVNVRRTFNVSSLKKYDVIYGQGNCTIAHYCVIFKITKEFAYGINLTSEERYFAPFQIKKSRVFKGKYMCKFINIFPIEEAKNSFCLVYDAKKEFDDIVNKIYEEYKNVFEK